MNSFKLRQFVRLAVALVVSATVASCASSTGFNDAPKDAPYALLTATGAQSYFQRGPLITHINGVTAPSSTSRNYYRLPITPTVLQLKAGQEGFGYPDIRFTPEAGRKYDVGYDGGRSYAVLFDITDANDARTITRVARKTIRE